MSRPSVVHFAALLVPAVAFSAALAHAPEPAISRIGEAAVAVADDVVVSRKPRDYLPETITTLALGGGSFVSNATGERPAWVGGLGVLGGLFGMLVGSEMMSDSSAPASLALTNIGVGVVSTAYGLRTLLGSTADTQATAAVRVTPWLPREGGAGVRLNVRF
jgi:hypothetical protein